ncbi:MAG TPA: adenosylcobalamin-dependent ribonucleoside-diphosphate reductase [Candidatus Binatia bacterium]|nr:adenosylcobalamin-dependent ribonucleoside-diphosphate reductase [Candidatus Binatia bacterium]
MKAERAGAGTGPAGPTPDNAERPGDALALGPNARRVLEARYLRRDATGAVVETPAQLFHRVARAVAQGELLVGTAEEADRWQATFHNLLASLDFLPNSPVLMNAGTPLGQLAACFVLPVEDTLESIFDALKAMALIQRSGGGTGFAFSRLRPRGDVLASSGGQASGPVSFIRIYDAATEHIKQGGRRRGANMGVLRVDHPDILEFVDAKRDGGLQNFNLSVAVTDDFMDAAAAGRSYELVHPGTGRVVGRLAAREVFDRIVSAAWQTGDPGLIYLDAVNRGNPTPALGRIETTNPCGEVPLLPWESCVLGSVNLARMVRTGGAAPAVDWERLGRTVRAGVRFLDDVIEVTREPLPEIAAATRANRKIGLGVMGFAEFLIRLGVPYDAPEAAAWGDRVMAFVARQAREASRELAAERGVFPNWERSVHAAAGDRLRNATLLSVAPTGTLAIIAGTSGGIEPLFALAYRRRHSLGGEPLVEVNPVFLHGLDARGLDVERILDAVLDAGTLRGVPDVPPDLARLFVTATEVPVHAHLAIQQAFQRHVDNAVSKTINLPEEADPADVAEAYLEAWRLGLKGVTVYRSGSRAGQVLELGAGEDMTAREYFARCDPGGCRL